ncbi:MAG TPA: hypothetical protein DCZ75_17505 [Geobacter sp.]|nr:hypothetical protein [Geobacter sp.]
MDKTKEAEMEKILKVAAAALLVTLCLFSVALAAAPLQLLSLEEAARPEARNFGFAAALRNDGPTISARDLEVPPGQTTFPLAVAFTAKDGTPVDINTLKLECLKSTPVDLTARVKPYAGKEGVNVDHISLPPGSYRFRVAISDFKGRFSEKEFTVKVSVNY